MHLNTVGEKIRVLRSMKGYSQAGLAMQCGLTQGQISYLEKSKNKKDCDPVIIEKICKGLDISLERLTNFGMESVNYLSAVKQLNKADTIIYDTLKSEEDIIEKLLSTMNVLFKVNEKYKKLLEECEKKSGGGVKVA